MEDTTWGATYFDYDPLGRLTERRTPDARVVEWTYDDDSTLQAIQYPGASGSAYYYYDEADRITAVKSPAGGNTYYEYDAAGNMTWRSFDNGTSSYFNYDNAFRLEALRTVSPSAALCYFEYDRDDAGDILVVDRPIEGYTHYYAYDPVKRLTSETIESSVGGGQLYAFTYDYDVAGNRTYANLQGVETYYTYDAANAITLKHELDTDTFSYYGYDENGSLTALQTPSGTTYFEYDDHGLCERIVPATGDTVYFSYDGRLTRFHMREGSTDTYFTWDGLNILEFEEGGTKTVLTHGATPVAGIGSVVELDEGGTKYYLHNDHRGTTFKITNAAGTVVWAGLVDAFGAELASSGTNPSIFWYQGQAWFRKEIGGRVHYVSPTRTYDAEDGRFVQRDRIRGKQAAPSLYEYSIRFVDPSGRICKAHFQSINVTQIAGDLGGPPNMDAADKFTPTFTLKAFTGEGEREINKCCAWAAWLGQARDDWSFVYPAPETQIEQSVELKTRPIADIVGLPLGSLTHWVLDNGQIWNRERAGAVYTRHYFGPHTLGPRPPKQHTWMRFPLMVVPLYEKLQPKPLWLVWHNDTYDLLLPMNGIFDIADILWPPGSTQSALNVRHKMPVGWVYLTAVILDVSLENPKVVDSRTLVGEVTFADTEAFKNFDAAMAFGREQWQENINRGNTFLVDWFDWDVAHHWTPPD